MLPTKQLLAAYNLPVLAWNCNYNTSIQVGLEMVLRMFLLRPCSALKSFGGDMTILQPTVFVTQFNACKPKQCSRGRSMMLPLPI